MFAAVDAYDRHVGRYSPKLARKLIEFAGVKPTDKVLDVGCGPGALTSELVRLLGIDHVAAVDPSPAFLEACRQRHPGISAEVASAESLLFGDGEFDICLAQLVVNFMSDPIAGVGEMRRVTRIGGTVGAAVWDYGSGMTLLRTFWDSAAAVNPSGGQRDERNMRMATPAELGDLWAAIGLEQVEVSEAVVSASYEGFEDLWQPLALGVGPAGAYAVSLEPDLREMLKQDLRARLAVGESPFELTARAWVVVGRVG